MWKWLRNQAGQERSSPARQGSGLGERRSTLRDPDLQHEFERVGYVVVDLLDEATVSKLTDAYEQMSHEPINDYAWVEGFSTSIYDSRPHYRADVLALMDVHVAPALDRILDRYSIFWANFLVKAPNADAVPPHVDWTFLDEDRYSSATVWCPLVDTSAAGGALGVVDGSHHRIDFVRSANVPTYERCEAAVVDLVDRPVLQVHAGQAVVMDNRVVHFSTPNSLKQPRVVVGCVVSPSEAPLHHWWVDERDRMVRFEVERDFYLTYEIGRPPYTASGVLAASTHLTRLTTGHSEFG